MAHGFTAVVPAAGRSERYGAMKLLADIRGEPLLDHTLRCLVDAGASAVVVVTAPEAALGAATLLGHPRVRTVVNADPARGMFSSIQTGLAAAGGGPVLVLPADMPFVGPRTVARVAEECARTGDVVVPAYRDRRGHPAGLPARVCAPLLDRAPTDTLKHALEALGEPLRLIAVDDAGVVRDVDRPEDLGPGR